jgi:hypothetical protein
VEDAAAVVAVVDVVDVVDAEVRTCFVFEAIICHR